MDIQSMQHFEGTTKIVDAICAKTQNYNKAFYRNLVNYNLSKAASMMRTTINYPGRGRIPVNFYGISLAPSGFSKGFSTNIVETQMMEGFLTQFKESTFHSLAQQRIMKLAMQRAINKSSDPDEEAEKLEQDFNSSGELLTEFDEATVPALKQTRRKLIIADAGSLNYIVDEIGQNLIKSQDVLAAFLEMYDVGRIKEKLIKNTSENVRGSELQGSTPANMMLYGTPVKLLDSGNTERLFEGFCEMGYARRSHFCFIDTHNVKVASVDERMEILMGPDTSESLVEAYDKLQSLANPAYINQSLYVPEDVLRTLTEYQVFCEERSHAMPAHKDMEKAEMFHRYFKTVKLAGAFAFYDNSPQIAMEHIHGAIKDTEESGEAFYRMRNRERDYVRLARYIASTPNRVTHVDICEDLPFYPATGGAKRNDMISMAMTWGHKNGVVIKKHYEDSIEMFSGSQLLRTDLGKLTLSHSAGLAYGYTNDVAPWDKLDRLLKRDNYNWCNHHLNGQHRDENECIPGFDMIVLDVDGGNTPVETAKILLQDYTYTIYTTKSHTDEDPHYRIIMPLSHRLEMEKEEYTEFMENVYDWLPIDCDTSTKDRVRKWATCAFGAISSNEGDLIDSLMFIPKTKKNEQMHEEARKLKNMDSIERWFIANTGDGNRNNNLTRYAFMLADSGYPLVDVEGAVRELNDKMADSLTEKELSSTILVSLAKRY